jgi:hypothetical protein
MVAEKSGLMRMKACEHEDAHGNADRTLGVSAG